MKRNATVTIFTPEYRVQYRKINGQLTEVLIMIEMQCK